MDQFEEYIRTYPEHLPRQGSELREALLEQAEIMVSRGDLDAESLKVMFPELE